MPTSLGDPSSDQKQVVNSVRIDKMLDLPEDTVFDQIPEHMRGNYLLRGSSAGRFALNLMLGADRVNPFDDLYMHVGKPGDHHTPLQFAKESANGFSVLSPPPLGQFGPEANEQWRDLTGSEPHHFPGIVYGIPRAYEDRLVLHPRTVQWVIGEAVPFRHIDPYSQELLGRLFEIDLSRH